MPKRTIGHRALIQGIMIMTAVVCFLIPPCAATAKTYQQNIAAVVNETAITTRDVTERMKLIMASSGLANTPDMTARVRPQVLGMLIEEHVKLDEAARLKIDIDETLIDNAIQKIAEQNKMSRPSFEKMLKTQGISVTTLRNQIRAQLSWARVVTRQIKPQVVISDREIDAELDRLRSKVGQTEVLLFEIVLPAATTKEKSKSQDLATRLMSELKRDPGRFPQLAAQFSRAATAAQGGQMGWVGIDQLDPSIADRVRDAEPRSVIGPLSTPAGLTILGVRERRSRSLDNLPPRDEIGIRMGNERLDRMQRLYYQDLRAASYIDDRS